MDKDKYQNQGLSLSDNKSEIADTLESILCDSDRCEEFAEVVLEEIRSDEEQLHHIGSNVIKAYQNGDCDELLIAICGWSMDSLLKKCQKHRQNIASVRRVKKGPPLCDD